MRATRIKICGLTRSEDIRHAVAAGADALGLVFYAQSGRYVDIELARDLARDIPPFVHLVGLFVNAEREWVESVLAAVPLSLIQFHGDEKSAYCESFSRPYIKALRFKTGQLNTAERDACERDLRRAIADHPAARGFLLDAMHDKLAGGTGEVFDWSLIPRDLGRPLILAGGLRADNVAQAIDEVAPYAIDVSSGVEAAVGVKSEQLITQFISAAKRDSNAPAATE